MSINSSSNDSLPHPSFINSTFPHMINCFIYGSSSLLFIMFSITNILLLLPLCVLILYLGLQRRLQQCSSSTAATVSHSDSFTYHMVYMELFAVSGFTVFCCGVFMVNLWIIRVGLGLVTFTWFGELSFHMLTCVEHYLAIVHPLIYLGLRNERGIRIRNITIGCVWLLCFTATCLVMADGASSILDLCFLGFSLIVISFCCVSVLCVLIRPGPGEQGGNRERVDQPKQRAFYTIAAIMGVLLLKGSLHLAWAAMYALNQRYDCVMITCAMWFDLPGRVVLPVLFLHRSGKLQCCKNNIE